MLVSELSRQELTLEDFIDGYFTLKFRLQPSEYEIEVMVLYQSKRFSRPITCQELGLSEDEFNNILRGLKARMGMGDDKARIEDTIDGFIRLRRRLGCPDEDTREWMLVYRTKGFDRRATAEELGMKYATFKERLRQSKKDLKIKARSIRQG